MYVPLFAAGAPRDGAALPPVHGGQPGARRLRRLVAQVAAVRDALPAGEKAVVFAANYGEAGAVELLGARSGLGQPVSGHNSYWTWGPPAADPTTVIAVGVEDRARLDALFGDVRRAGTVDNGVGVDNEEQGGAIWICREPLAPWSRLWPAVRHYNS